MPKRPAARRGRRIIRSLSWHAAIRLDIYEQRGLIVVRPDNSGSHAVNRHGYFAIPAAVRRWSDLGSGERVLLVADPVGQALVVHPPKALDHAVAAAHVATFGGDQP